MISGKLRTSSKGGLRAVLAIGAQPTIDDRWLDVMRGFMTGFHPVASGAITSWDAT
jgi:hypothetical protein